MDTYSLSLTAVVGQFALIIVLNAVSRPHPLIPKGARAQLPLGIQRVSKDLDPN
jgi:hypothetical protein